MRHERTCGIGSSEVASDSEARSSASILSAILVGRYASPNVAREERREAADGAMQSLVSSPRVLRDRDLHSTLERERRGLRTHVVACYFLARCLCANKPGVAQSSMTCDSCRRNPSSFREDAQGAVDAHREPFAALLTGRKSVGLL